MSFTYHVSSVNIETQEYPGSTHGSSEKEEKRWQRKWNRKEIFLISSKTPAKDPKLQKKMTHLIKKKGKGITPEKLLKQFHDLGYDGVSLRDCQKAIG